MAKCFGRNGTEVSSLFLCDTAAAGQGKHTSCCGSNQRCLTNGMCRNAGITDTTNFDWIGGCTDSSFDDPACAKYCGADGELVWQCTAAETYCCHTGTIPKYNNRKDRTNLTCCTIDELVFKASNPIVFATAQAATLSRVPVAISSKLASGSSTAALSAIPTTTAGMSSITSIATIQPSSSTPESTSSTVSSRSPAFPLVIGLSAGFGGAATITLIVGSLFIWWRKRAMKSKRVGERHEMMGVIPAEISGTEKPLELQRSRSPTEMFVPKQTVELPGEEVRDGKDRKLQYMGAVQ